VLSGSATSKDSTYASICVAYQENFVITSASPAMSNSYGTVFGLAQPTVTAGLGSATPTIDDLSKLNSFPLQMWIQDPYYSPTVCFSYYWNCDSYTDQSMCTSTSSTVIFGNDDCFSGQTEISSYSQEASAWTTTIADYRFDSAVDTLSSSISAYLMSAF
jgi:hypothetical protein